MSDFWGDESGAVTVEWTVLVAGVGTLALATVSALQLAIAELSRGTVPNSIPVAFQSFDQHASGWSNPGSGDLGNVGTGVLGPFRVDDGAERTTRTFSFPDWANRALLEFDVARLGSRPETLIVYAGNAPVRFVALTARADDDGALLPVRVTIPVTDPEMTIGFGATSDDERGEWALDTLTVEALR